MIGRTKPIRVLVIDPSPEKRVFIKHLLDEDRDYVVMSVDRFSPEAMALPTAFRPDVVLLDMDTPQDELQDITHVLQQHHPSPAIITCYMSVRQMVPSMTSSPSNGRTTAVYTRTLNAQACDAFKTMLHTRIHAAAHHGRQALSVPLPTLHRVKQEVAN